MFYINRVLECLLLPPFAPLSLIALGLCISNWRPVLGRGLAWSGLLVALLLILPVSVDRLLAPLEQAAVALPARLEKADLKGAEAIVILGGGGRKGAIEYGQPTVNRITLERLRYGAKLARASGLPILVSGGVAGARYPEAQMMAASLKADFGLTPLWMEDRSINTAENAKNTETMLQAAGIRHIILVTHAAHMRRALGYFEHTSLKVTPAPTAFFGPLTDSENSLSWLPSANSAYAGWYAAHEWAGLLQQRFIK